MTASQDDENDRDKEVNEAFATYLRLIDDGGVPNLEGFLESYPALSVQLRELITTSSTVRAMAAGTGTFHTPKNQQSYELDTLALDAHDLLDETAARGDLVGEYELIEELGRGGMGVVYKARQKGMNRLVALKMILGGKYSSDDSIRRFYKEAKAAGRLAHANIVRAFAAGEHDGRHFFAMELIEGRTLGEILKSQDQKLSNTKVGRYMKSLAEAVQYAHDQGILHRDLKPSNVIIDHDDLPKIADFGLAKLLNQEDRSFDSASGAIVGTPSYMSPEQAASRRDDVGPASDLYSLGAILYEMLTGQPPFKGESPLATLLLVLNQDVTPPSDLNPSCHPGLEAICLKCLEKDPQDRYNTCEDLTADFDRFLRAEPVKARRLTSLQRTRNWLRGIPLVAFALGRNPASATQAQHRAQWATLVSVAAVLVLLASRTAMTEYAYLMKVDIGVGLVAGEYDRIGNMISQTFPAGKSQVVNTAGSVDCRERLLNFDVDLGILQDNTMSYEDIVIVAPLYREVILIVVRSDSEIEQARGLAHKKIALGELNSGSRATSDQILGNLGISTAAEYRDCSWTDLDTHPAIDGAIITAALRHVKLTKLLKSGEFRILPLQRDELADRFRQYTLTAEDLPTAYQIDEAGLTTATTEAVLAVRKDAPAWFVRRCLTSIYASKNNELNESILNLEDAAAWSEGRSLHAAAREFFKSIR